MVHQKLQHDTPDYRLKNLCPACHHRVMESCTLLPLMFVLQLIPIRAKYPLASAEKLIHTFSKNILFAYDIGCTFSATLLKLSIGDLVKEANFRCCTGSFHGATHHRACQLDFLISLQKGAGIEDGVRWCPRTQL
ncbi:uncharacterized protein EI90DRAFT_2901355 [Cantharellus anzutake]|uniref:uncharacterized protein n=1 Tax=Cantharellus anzutake TaxID=1750568 RepID=UPI001906F6FB|nr:uncharacterized protein EI90DRAFT_2901355 [Cantharellus anzutake]KAF8343922.1 hypothetical protein EI90DRAFT_2901355 [Cantharellus anzutake]